MSLLLLAGAPSAQVHAASFIRGDVNASGSVNITDAIGIFRHLFLGDTAVLRCMAAGDVDGNGRVDVTDGIRLLSYLFIGGDPPTVQSLGVCVADIAEESLGCELSFSCRTKGVFLIGSRGDFMREGTKFRDLQRAMIRAIGDLSEEDEFAVIIYDARMVMFPQSGFPAQATGAMKEAAIAFISATALGSSSCVKPALLQALHFAEESSSHEKSILFVSDGIVLCAPGCDLVQCPQESLALVRAKNTDRVPINVIGVGVPPTLDEDWLKALAAQNGGTYTRGTR